MDERMERFDIEFNIKQYKGHITTEEIEYRLKNYVSEIFGVELSDIEVDQIY